MEYKIEEYKVVGRIGEGAHGVVLRARHTHTGQHVALKRMIHSNAEDKIPLNVLREVKSLQHVNSKYVVKLVGVLTSGPSLVLILELMAGGLGTVLSDIHHPVSAVQYKAYARMLLTGLQHLHQISIMHRDLKPANLLIGYDGILRIADLGQARLAKGRPFSHQVGSRWYRSPELLYGARKYSYPVDMWSVGCIVAEMVNRSPLFPGESDIEQLAIVMKSLGSPTEESWPELRSLPDYGKISFPAARAKSWKSLVPDPPPAGIEFIKALLVYNPSHRLTADQALNHHFFQTEPVGLRDEQMQAPHILIDNSTTHKKLLDIDQPLEDSFVNLKAMFPF